MSEEVSTQTDVDYEYGGGKVRLYKKIVIEIAGNPPGMHFPSWMNIHHGEEIPCLTKEDYDLCYKLLLDFKNTPDSEVLRKDRMRKLFRECADTVREKAQAAASMRKKYGTD